MKLLKCSDYILITPNDIETYTNKLIWRYAKFVKQLLSIGMFVPCDLNKNILIEPKHFFEWSTRTLGTSLTEIELDAAATSCREYKEALSRVIFEGFDANANEGSDSKFWTIKYGELSLQWSTEEQCFFMWSGHTVEDLARYDITLTDSAVESFRSKIN